MEMTDAIDAGAKVLLQAELSRQDDVNDEWECYTDSDRAHYRDLAKKVIGAVASELLRIERRTFGSPANSTPE